MQEHGKSLKQKILSGKYVPQPVRRVEISKPNGGIRLPGIPTVIDRLLHLIRAYLKTGRMLDGRLASPTGEGVPLGGP